MPLRLCNITKRLHYFRNVSLDEVQIKFTTELKVEIMDAFTSLGCRYSKWWHQELNIKHNALNNFWDLTKQNNLMTSISSWHALYNPYFNLQTTSQFPQHFHSLGYTSHKTNKEASTVLCSVVKHLGSGRALKKWGKILDFVSCFPLRFFRALPLPACFTTEQSTVEAS